MKRKLDQDDLPVEASNEAEATHQDISGFADLKLDARLLRAIIKEKYLEPTQVQALAIPLALAGKDVLGLDFPLRKK
jgi:superfamily II DNA/RNA helicase